MIDIHLKEILLLSTQLFTMLGSILVLFLLLLLFARCSHCLSYSQLPHLFWWVPLDAHVKA